MKCIVNGRILMPDGIVDGKVLAFGRCIEGIIDAPPPDAEIIDAEGGYVAPGLIDVHCHGLMGMDASHGSIEELRQMSAFKARNGVTAWLPTTMTLDWTALEGCFSAVRQAMAESLTPGWQGAQVLGCHAEGPFINPKRKGAQAAEYIQPPDIDRLRPWRDVVCLMTVAPEMDGATDFIREAAAMGVTISLGHSDATAEQAMAGFGAGARHVTHTFNAMPPLNHRQPGLIGAALNDDRIYCELIADTFHVSPLLFPMMARLIPRRLVLITDSIRCAGLPDGQYDLLGVNVTVDGIQCRLDDGTIAGSVLTLDRAVRNFAKYADIPLWQAVNMASLYPARSIGVDGRKGSLCPGRDADIILTDDGFHVRATFVGGTGLK